MIIELVPPAALFLVGVYVIIVSLKRQEALWPGGILMGVGFFLAFGLLMSGPK